MTIIKSSGKNEVCPKSWTKSQLFGSLQAAAAFFI